MQRETRSRAVELSAEGGVKITSRSPHEQCVKDALDAGQLDVAMKMLDRIPETPTQRIFHHFADKVCGKRED